MNKLKDRIYPDSIEIVLIVNESLALKWRAKYPETLLRDVFAVPKAEFGEEYISNLLTNGTKKGACLDMELSYHDEEIEMHSVAYEDNDIDEVLKKIKVNIGRVIKDIEIGAYD